MNRIDFLKSLGLVTVGIAVGPKLLAEHKPLTDVTLMGDAWIDLDDDVRVKYQVHGFKKLLTESNFKLKISGASYQTETTRIIPERNERRKTTFTGRFKTVKDRQKFFTRAIGYQPYYFDRNELPEIERLISDFHIHEEINMWLWENTYNRLDIEMVNGHIYDHSDSGFHGPKRSRIRENPNMLVLDYVNYLKPPVA